MRSHSRDSTCGGIWWGTGPGLDWDIWQGTGVGLGVSGGTGVGLGVSCRGQGLDWGFLVRDRGWIGGI